MAHSTDIKKSMVSVQTSPNVKRSPAPRKKNEDLDTWLTRAQATDLLGVSKETLENYERRGMLSPRRATRLDSGGAVRQLWIYDPVQLAAIPRRKPSDLARSPGERAGRAFELFDLGRPLREIVIELRETPEAVATLREQWLDMAGSDLVIYPLAKEALEQLLGSFTTVADLVEIVRAKVPQPTCDGKHDAPACGERCWINAAPPYADGVEA